MTIHLDSQDFVLKLFRRI